MISLRDPQGDPHVTIELAEKDSWVGDGVFATPTGAGTIIQIKGKQNEEPGRKSWPAVKRLYQHLGMPKTHQKLSPELERFVYGSEPG
jgi:hypothetical protein